MYLSKERQKFNSEKVMVQMKNNSVYKEDKVREKEIVYQISAVIKDIIDVEKLDLILFKK